MAYILYNMTFNEIYEPVIYKKFEEGYTTVSSTHMSARVAFGGVYAYYKSNQGTMFGIDFWESKLEDHVDDMRPHEVLSLLEAFKDNRRLHRDHIREKMDSQFKKLLMDKWNDQVHNNQAVLFGLARELHALQYYDHELWKLMIDSAINKGKINNTYYFVEMHRIMLDLNSNKDAKNLYKNLDKKIKEFLKRHYTENRKWKYDAENAHKLSL